MGRAEAGRGHPHLIARQEVHLEGADMFVIGRNSHRGGVTGVIGGMAFVVFGIELTMSVSFNGAERIRILFPFDDGAQAGVPVARQRPAADL